MSDRLIFMRDGRFVNETTLAGAPAPKLGAAAGLEL
jgi:hypothetical protein